MAGRWRSIRTGFLAWMVLSGVAATGQGSEGENGEDPVITRLADRGYRIGPEVQRIQDYRIHGFNYLDRKAIIFHAGASRQYLIRFRNPCQELRSSNTIAFTDTVGNLTTKDRVVARGPGGFPERCLIESMWELERIPEDG